MEIEKYILERMQIHESILKEPLTPDNIKTLSYADKVGALCCLNELITIMKALDPSFEYDVSILL
jgi:hypothetical protein